MGWMDLVEWLGALTGVVCVYLAARAKILTWPIGIVSVTLFAFFFWHLKLYADAGLQVFYIATGVIGWWHWSRGGPEHSKAPIVKIGNLGRLSLVGATLLATGLLGYFLDSRTDASLPYWDSFTTCFSIVAQILLMRKVFETWPLWVGVDVVAIGVYTVKAATVTAGLYGIFLILAIGGWISWIRLYREQETRR
jgi:nicotinamide mononucleotide transporter